MVNFKTIEKQISIFEKLGIKLSLFLELRTDGVIEKLHSSRNHKIGAITDPRQTNPIQGNTRRDEH